MSLRMWSAIPQRIVQVLQDYLPDELDLIDAEEADGITTPDVQTTEYYRWLTPVSPTFPAIRIETVGARPVEVRPDSFGQRVDAVYLYRIHADAGIDNADSSPLLLQTYVERYVKGIIRVLAVKSSRLETVADPNPFVEHLEWNEVASVGPEPGQEGIFVRTGVVPIAVRRREQRI